VPTVRVRESDLRAADPALDTLANLNAPDEYEAALHRLGGAVGRVRVELYEVARQLAGTDALEVEATTLGEALRAVAARHPALEGAVISGDHLARHWRASLGGHRFVDDPATPLPAGVSLLLLSALAGG
jgi:sulfur-carrier protein